MSRRNSLASKRGRRVAKALRQPPKGYTDLVSWVKIREHVSTRKAITIILTGCLKVDSHTVGLEKVGKDNVRLVRYIPAEQARRMRVVVPEALKSVA